MPKVIKAFPPNFTTLKTVFPIAGRQGIIYAFGDRIYNPHGVTLSPWIYAHEDEHCKRQNAQGVWSWWDAYTANARFRLAEEVYAHRIEWAKYCASFATDKQAEQYLEMMVERLSGPLYKHMVTPSEARAFIVGQGDVNAIYQR